VLLPASRATLLLLPTLILLYFNHGGEKSYGSCFVFSFNGEEERKMRVLRIGIRALGVGLGVFALIFGEADDSPGLQGIGMILLMLVFFSIFKIVKRR
jgi:hypothetical protein